MSEPVIPERPNPRRRSFYRELIVQRDDAVAKVAEQAVEIEKLQFTLDMTGVLLLHKQMAEQAATIAEQKTDLILSAAMLLRKLGLDHLKLGEIRTECFDDSHWALMIDAALKQRMEAKKL